jgi:hypothetical protein
VSLIPNSRLDVSRAEMLLDDAAAVLIHASLLGVYGLDGWYIFQ